MFLLVDISTVCVCFADRILKLIDYYEGSFQDYVGHDDAVSLTRFAADGARLLTASQNEVIMWDVTV